MREPTPDTGDGPLPSLGDDLGDGLSEDLRARVKGELEPGERLLWASRSWPLPEPMGLAVFVWSAIAFLLLTVAAALIVHGRHRPRWQQDSDPKVWAICMVLLGGFIVICVIGHLIAKRAERGRQADVYYAVTERRAIIWTPEPKGNAVRVQSLQRGRIGDVVRIQRSDGSGSLEFSMSRNGDDFTWPRHAFQDIAEVRRVEQIVRNYLITTEGPA